MKKGLTMGWKKTLCALALTGLALACPGESFADGSAKEFRGHFEVYVEGKKKTGVVWSKRIKDVRVIRLGRNFLIFTTEDAGYSYHQSTVDSFTWKPMKKDGVAKTTIVKGKAKAKGKAKKSEKQLSAEIDGLFKEIDELIEKGEYDGLLKRFEKLRAIMDEYEGLGVELSQKKLEEWKKRSQDQEFADVEKALQLQVYVSRGNQILRGMATNLRENKNGRVIRAFKDMEKLCAEMRAQKDELLNRNAKALIERAKELKEKASKNLRDK